MVHLVKRCLFTAEDKFKKIIFIIQTQGINGILIFSKSFFIRAFGGSVSYTSADSDFELISNLISDVSQNSSNKKFRMSSGSKKIHLNWFIPDFGIGSGGHMTIFRIISYLEKSGFKNNIYMIGSLRYANPEIIKNTINKYYVPLKAKVFIGIDSVVSSHGTIATSWHTAYAVNNIKNTEKKFYLVQDFEPSFYPISSSSILAENTYKLGFFHICASRWLSEKLKNEYGAKASYFSLACDQKTYHPNLNIKRKKKTICFYARWATARRGVELGLIALKMVYKKYPDLEIILYGWDADFLPKDLPVKNVGILTSDELTRLYNESTIGLVISLTNVSIVPFEMMGCKLPVVGTEHPSLLEIFENNKNVILSKSDPYDLAKIICELLESPKNQKKIAESAFENIQKLSWEKSFETIKENLLTVFKKIE